MATRNKFQIIGRLTADVKAVVNQENFVKYRFTVAVERDFKNNEGVKETDFIQVEAIRNHNVKAEEYFASLQKGELVVVEGEIRNNNYYGKDGKPVYSNVLHCDSVTRLSTPKSR